MIYINITNYKDLVELIKSAELIRDNATESKLAINNYLNSIERPKGYKSKTSYTDYDAIHGTRSDVNIEIVIRLVAEAKQLDNIILLQETNLDRYYKMQKEIDDCLDKVTDITVKVSMLRAKGFTQEEVSELVEKSTRTIQRLDKKSREEN